MIAHVAFVVFLGCYIFEVFELVGSLYHSPVNVVNIITMLAMLIIAILIFRIIYIIAENSISFIWAIVFSKKLKEHYFLRKRKKLVDKYKIIHKLFYNKSLKCLFTNAEL